MPATNLTIQQIKVSALATISLASTPDSANGNTWANTGREFLMVVTASASGATPTVAPIAKFENVITIPSPTYGAIGASTTVMIGPFNPIDYGVNPTIAWSAVTGTVNVAIVQLPPNPA